MIDLAQILPNLYVGIDPQDLEDIQELRDRCRVTAVLNLQTDEDLRARGLDWPALEAAYELEGIEIYRVPMRDFDYDHQREQLPEAVKMLAKLLAEGHITYLHCNAGVGRSPLVAMAYLSWCCHLSHKEAIAYVQERRPCSPFEDLLETSHEKVCPRSG